MKRYQEILIGIGNPEVDGPLLDYVAALTRFAESRRIHLLHVDKTPTTIDDPVDVVALQDLADSRLKDKSVGEVVCQVIKGAPAAEIIKYSQEKSVDLIVLGGDGTEPNREADLGRRVTRKSNCSVLILPKNATPTVKKILVPVRDTACSQQAVETAIEVAAPIGASLVVLNVFQVHSGITRGNLTLEDYIEQQRQIVGKETANLLSRVDLHGVQVEPLCVPDTNGYPVDRFLEAVQETEADMIVVGARGRSGLAGVLLADVTEKLIKRSPVPLLASKKKGEVLGILGALMTITQQEE